MDSYLELPSFDAMNLPKNELEFQVNNINGVNTLAGFHLKNLVFNYKAAFCEITDRIELYDFPWKNMGRDVLFESREVN